MSQIALKNYVEFTRAELADKRLDDLERSYAESEYHQRIPEWGAADQWCYVSKALLEGTQQRILRDLAIAEITRRKAAG